MRKVFFYKITLVAIFLLVILTQTRAQSVQQQLTNGVHPCAITGNGIPIDSLIGKTYGGGLIFYFDSITCEGLVAAPASQDTMAIWGCWPNDLPTVPNVINAGPPPQGPGAELFDGKTNTPGIISGCMPLGIAADLANGYNGSGFLDWYLPSILELDEMHKTIGQGGTNIGEFQDKYYWSSSESNGTTAWIQFFTSTFSNLAAGPKFESQRVRAVRKITAPPPPTPAKIIYVDSSASGAHTGENWVDAFNEIQDAFFIAAACDSIFVASANYYPDTTGLLNHRSATFNIPNSVRIFGGFPAGGGLRDVDSFETVLSGAIDADSANYAYHVVTMKNLSIKTWLDGFTISDGRADGAGVNESDAGGIIHIADIVGQLSSPTIINCTFNNNIGTSRGGAIYNLALDSGSICSPIIKNSLFQSNKVIGSNGEGGGICNDAIEGYCFVTIDSSQFIDNFVTKSGGAIHNHANSDGETSFSIKNTLFKNNVAQGSDGGGLSCFHVMGKTTNATIENCQFLDNTSNFGGGGLSAGVSQDDDSIQMTLTDCLFEENSVLAGDGGGIAYYAFGGQTNINITRTVFRNNQCSIGGGGILLSANDSFATSNSTMTDCIFEGNNATYGGGVSLFAGFGAVQSKIVQCLFFNDTARFGGAIDMFAEETTSSVNPEILNCTFVKNTTTGSSAIAAEAIDGEASPLILNSIIWSNQDTLGQAGFISFGATPTIDYTLVDTSCAGLGDNVSCGANMIYNIDPNFISLDTCNLHFNGGSIAVNAGQNDSLITNGILLDLDGDTRIKSGTVDLGVYEFEPCPNIITLLNESQTAGNFHATMKVESNGFLKSMNQAVYKAGIEIDLLPAFEVPLGAEFEASIDPCVP